MPAGTGIFTQGDDMNFPEKLTNGQSLSQAWNKINEIIDILPALSIVVDNKTLSRRQNVWGTSLQIRGQAGNNIISAGYMGDFRVDLEQKEGEEKEATCYIFSPVQDPLPIAGEVCIDGILHYCKPGKIALNATDKKQFKLETFDGETRKKSYICITAHNGEFAGYKATATPAMWRYVGDFAARMGKGGISIVDGASPKSEYAGRARIDGIYKSVPALSIPAGDIPKKGGYLCAEFRRGEFYRYTFRKTPAMWAYCGYFAARLGAGGISIVDGAKPTASTAGKACIDGIYKSLPALSIPAGDIPKKGGYLCIECRRGEFYRYTFRETPAMWAYCGYFAARLTPGGGISIVDGAKPTASTAGKVIIDGEEISLGAVGFQPKSGRIGIRVSPDGKASIEYE